MTFTEIRLRVPVATPTLALGADSEAVFAYADGDAAIISAPFGDLDELATYEAFAAAVADLGRRQPMPRQVVRDLHPDYATTRLAEQLGIPTVAVQHQHAHFAAAFVDAGVHGPALGLILDEPGYGADGTFWGGEILVGDPADVWRAAHLATIPLPGGERTAAEPWRMAVAYLAAAGEPYADVHADADRAAAQCSRAPRTTSAARLFDAVAAIVGVASASQLEALARGVEPEGAYPFELRGEELVIVPAIRAIARDARRHLDRARIARRFHTTIVELFAHACDQLARGEGLRDVVLSGSLFGNAILATELPERLRSLGLVPHVHRQLPPDDRCIAFGQLAVAAATGATRTPT